MSVHFVYAAWPGRGKLPSARHRLVLLAQRCGLPASLVGVREAVRTDGWVRAPLSITANLYRTFLKKAPTFLYDWTEEVAIPGGAGDILIGHPYPDDERKTWNRSCREGGFSLRIAMLPLSHRMAEVNGKFDHYIPLVDAVFGIMGPHWFDTWHESALAHWKPKIVPLDMAIDVTRFPRIKKEFHPPGKRKFLYIGGSGPQKGTHLLSILFGMTSRHRCLSVGSHSPIRNLEYRPWTPLSEGFVKRLAEECDFFITMGVSDANPTTILEAMAWGFPVCCTPESGYYNMPEIVPMSITDMKRNLETLDHLQGMPERDLRDRTDSARSLVEQRFTWKRFTETVVREVERLSAAKGIDPWKA